MPVDARRVPGALAVAVLAASLPACLSPVPLDPTPQADLDPRILGSWRCLGPEMADDDKPLDLVITRARAGVYSVTFDEIGEESPDRYEAHASKVGERTVVNVRDLSAGRDPWDFATHTFLRPDVLALALAVDGLEGVERTPAALRARLSHPDAFTDFCVCLRQKEKG